MWSSVVVHNVRVSDADEPTAADDPPRYVGGKRRRDVTADDVVVDSVDEGADDQTDDQTDDDAGDHNDEPVGKKSGTGRRVTFWIGIGLILAGLGLLGYVAWQFWGTNWVSKRHQREITSELEKDWASGNGKKPEYIPKGEASALIRIPRFGKKYVVPVLEGTGQDILAKGYGHFEKTKNPGEIGNYAVAAHRVTHGEPLRHMPDLRPGDKVIVETVDATYTYELDTNPNDLVISFTGVWVIDPLLPHNPEPGGPEPEQVPGQRLITLTTCSEIFHTDNRMIAFGHLVKAEMKTTAKARASKKDAAG
jgi:sortase A